jgi:ArsR family transcriptional regulator
MSEATAAPAEVLTVEQARIIGRYFQVLADPTRVRMIRALAEGEWCVSDLAEALRMDQPAVSYQLKLLREWGLVKRTPSGRHMYYRLADAHLRSVLLGTIDHLRAV